MGFLLSSPEPHERDCNFCRTFSHPTSEARKWQGRRESEWRRENRRKEERLGISLTAQWLMLHTPAVGGCGLDPVRELRSHMLCGAVEEEKTKLEAQEGESEEGLEVNPSLGHLLRLYLSQWLSR